MKLYKNFPDPIRSQKAQVRFRKILECESRHARCELYKRFVLRYPHARSHFHMLYNISSADTSNSDCECCAECNNYLDLINRCLLFDIDIPTDLSTRVHCISYARTELSLPY